MEVPGNRFVEAYIHGKAQVEGKNLSKGIPLLRSSLTTEPPILGRATVRVGEIVRVTSKSSQLTGPES
jgi:hypothetical protein